MAAVLDPTEQTAKHDAQVDSQLAQATSRIRTHDLAFGALILVALALVYTTAMILLDKSLNLPQWVRQVSLLGFVAALAGTAYFTVVQPFRKKINPLYAAKQVEGTLDDPKNSVTGYVDAQQKGELNATVKAALARRASQAAADADVNKAVDHRSLLWLGGVAVGLFLALVVLFFVFRPAQFASLVGRTFVPFSSDPIASRTQITLLKPDPAEPTITTGQSVSVAVHVGGKVPSADSPEKMRLMIRHNPLDPNYTELPLVQGNTNRDWELRVPDYLVQNGFWYKIAGGDAETPEYKVSVRSLPLFTDFTATYDYPKYLRRAPETARDAQIKAYKGTVVTLVAKTNRKVLLGEMQIEPGGQRVAGDLVFGQPDSLRFTFKLTESGRYKLHFTSTDMERSADPYQSTITVLADTAPSVVINKPEDEETTLPTNGLLAIDGKVGDDFGVDTVTLKMKIVGAAERPLPDKPFLNGKVASFRRLKDDTWPTDVDYKASVDLAKLTKDAAGVNLALTPDTVIEYWLEATDNCAEPRPNVGRSASKRVRLTPPKVEEAEKQNLDNEKAARQNEEQKANGQQEQKFNQEKRDPQQGGKPQEGQPQPKGGEKGDGKPEPKAGEQPKGGDAQPKTDDKGTEPKTGEPKKENDPSGAKGMTDPTGMPPPKGAEPPKGGMPDGKNTTPDGMNPTMPPADPMNPNNMGMGQPDTAPMPKTPEDKDLQNKADKLNDAIKKENEDGGTPKPNNAPAEGDRANPAQPKPQPMGGDMGNMAEPKPEQKPQPMGAMGDKAPPAEPKPEGNVEKPADPAAPKPTDPQQGQPMGMGMQKPAQPSEKREEPIGQPTAQEKPPADPMAPQPKNPNDKPNEKKDPNSGATAKPCENPNASGANGEKSSDNKNPAADAGSKAKPMPEQNRGGDKPSEPKGASGTDPKADPKTDKKPDAGDAKPEKAPPAAGSKPAPPMGDMMNPAAGGMNPTETKPDANANKPNKPNGTEAAENKPDTDKKSPMAGGGGMPGTEKAEDKPSPDANAKPQGGAGGAKEQPKQKELTAKEKQELEEAVKNLTNPDPEKKKDAQQKLDKAVGEDKRKEVEKLAQDLQSPDKNTRDAANQKLDDIKKQAQAGAADKKEDGKGGGAGDKKDAPKLDEKQMKEIADAMKDLQSGDDKQKQAARDKLDKMIGEGARKEAEQLSKDLQSPDKETRDAAKKKIEDAMKKEQDKDGKGKDEGKEKEPTKEELDALAKAAKDLQSPDPETRAKAQKELDDKLGKENRQKLEEAMKNGKPGNPEDEKKLKEELEKLAKEQAKKEHDPTRGGLGSGGRLNGPMEDDPKNRLKSAELRLEDFERKQYDEAFKRKQGFTDAEYEKFLNGYKDYVEQMRKEAATAPRAADKPPASEAPPPGTPMFNPGIAGKVESKSGASTGTGGGATVEPPGFEDSKRKFQELTKPKK